MTNSKRAVVVFTLAALLGTSAVSAYAQEAPVAAATEQPASQPGTWAKIKAKFGGRDGGRRGGGEMMQKLMIEIDADKSGTITQPEIDTFRAAKLASTDTSKDGALSLDEFSAAYNEMMKNRMVDAFQRLDDDGNGSITSAELDARFGNVVASMDRNSDGVLSQADRMQHSGKGGKHRGGDRNQMDGGNN